ncbi:MAG TPA: low molecular weight phosphatase family protein [Opitutaceae bacterium]|nr:low molecular weight phosphatase family protein [Opitutaceae bacterium]
MPEVLFICTGNYYRSRFAEAVFNHHAQREKLAWRAFSRGLAIELAPQDSSLSEHTVDALQRRSIPLAHTAARPQSLVEADLKRATRIIALKDAEHRPMIARRFPAWESRVEFWHVSDIDQADPREAVDEIDARVRKLVAELSGGARPLPRS